MSPWFVPTYGDPAGHASVRRE